MSNGQLNNLQFEPDWINVSLYNIFMYILKNKKDIIRYYNFIVLMLKSSLLKMEKITKKMNQKIVETDFKNLNLQNNFNYKFNNLNAQNLKEFNKSIKFLIFGIN